MTVQADRTYPLWRHEADERQGRPLFEWDVHTGEVIRRRFFAVL